MRAGWQLPDPSNEQEYVRRCLEAEFTDEQETRKFRSDPALSNVSTLVSTKQYTQAISAVQALLPRINDFDLVYSCLSSVYRQTRRFAESRAVLIDGLAKAKCKGHLLTLLGEIDWESGDINGAVYWWSQALHCLVNPIEYDTYLFLSYVAKELGLADFERSLLARANSLHSGLIRLDPRLDPMKAQRLTALVQNNRPEAMRKVLQGLQSKYFSSGTGAAAAMQPIRAEKKYCVECGKPIFTDVAGRDSGGSRLTPRNSRVKSHRPHESPLICTGKLGLKSHPPHFLKNPRHLLRL